MDNHSKRSRHNKPPKQPRRPRPIALRPIISGEIAPSFHHPSDILTNQSSAGADIDRLNDIIDDITSEGDDVRVGSSSQISTRSNSSRLVEPNSPPVNENHSSLYTLPTLNDTYRSRTSSSSMRSGRTKRFSTKDKRSQQFGDKKAFSPSRMNTFDDRTDSSSRRKSIGEQRRHQLTDCMEYYRHCLESAQNANAIGINDDPTNNEKRKQYTTALW